MLMEMERVEVCEEVRVRHVVDLAVHALEQRWEHLLHAEHRLDLVLPVSRGLRAVRPLDGHCMDGNELLARVHVHNGFDYDETGGEMELVVEELALAHDGVCGVEIVLVIFAPLQDLVTHVSCVNCLPAKKISVRNVENTSVVKHAIGKITQTRINSQNSHVICVDEKKKYIHNANSIVSASSVLVVCTTTLPAVSRYVEVIASSFGVSLAAVVYHGLVSNLDLK